MLNILADSEASDVYPRIPIPAWRLVVDEESPIRGGDDLIASLHLFDD
jgi:hypothetical protein